MYRDFNTDDDPVQIVRQQIAKDRAKWVPVYKHFLKLHPQADPEYNKTKQEASLFEAGFSCAER